MTEYISREAALNFETEIDADPDEIQAISRGMALYAEHIKAVPAADVVPVVRCKQCIYAQMDTMSYNTGMTLCKLPAWSPRLKSIEGYCDSGKEWPKTEEDKA